MFGLEDTWVMLAYVLCIASAGLCVVYGLVNWNKGQESEPVQLDEEAKWEKTEQKIDASL